jgi:large subunit ribosomal protein L10
MDRKQKKQFVEDFRGKLSASESLVIAHYSGLSVAQFTDFRAKARQIGASVRVPKNRLAKIAIEGTKFNNVMEFLSGPSVLIYSNDPVAAAKAACDYAKTNDKLVVIGGALNEAKLSANDVKQLSEMPSLDELRASLLALLNTPATRIAGVLQAPAGQVARVIAAYADKGN